MGKLYGPGSKAPTIFRKTARLRKLHRPARPTALEWPPASTTLGRSGLRSHWRLSVASRATPAARRPRELGVTSFRRSRPDPALFPLGSYTCSIPLCLACPGSQTVKDSHQLRCRPRPCVQVSLASVKTQVPENFVPVSNWCHARRPIFHFPSPRLREPPPLSAARHVEEPPVVPFHVFLGLAFFVY